ncbi:MAG: DedA family protein [Pseudonocardiaceae bacterium]
MAAITVQPDLATFSGLAIYLIVFTIIFVETGLLVGLLLPGDSILFAAGLLAANGHFGVSILVLTVTVLAAAVLGDSVGYGLGRRFGRRYLVRGLPRRGARFVAAAERLYARHGWFAIVAARWYPGIRAVVPVLAGIGRMPRGWFLSANVLGGLLWAVGLVVLGYLSYSIPGVRHLALVAMGLTIVATLAYPLIYWLRGRRGRCADPQSSRSV